MSTPQKKKKDINAGAAVEFTEKDAEIERLRSQLAIYKH